MIRILIAGLIAMTIAAGTAFANDISRHKVWDDLLETYVVEHADGVNRFDYGGLKSSARDVAALNAYLDSFEELDFETLSQAEQYAAWANIYNALTIQHMIGRYPVKSIKSGSLFGPWKKVKTVVDGKAISLDAIEHQVLRPMGDPRIHYAINCASYGCPNLRSDAWVAETLDEDLDAAAQAYINHKRGVAIRSKGGLQVSEIYKWFEEDFGGSEESVIAHLLEYANPVLAAEIRANADIRKYDYDWSLNDAK